MTANISRREFFRRAGSTSRQCGEQAIIRGFLPPWAVGDFAQSCDGCGACVDACPEDFLIQDITGDQARSAYPKAAFGHKECVFCGDCLRACPTGALHAGGAGLPDPMMAFHHHMHITANCLSWRGIACRLCEENCEPRAIRFHLQTEGRAAPDLDADSCSGCGACMAVCPEQAIIISQDKARSPQVVELHGGRE